MAQCSSSTPFQFKTGYYHRQYIASSGAGYYEFNIAILSGDLDDLGGLLIDNIDVSLMPVPKPSTIILVVSGLVGLVGLRMKKKRTGSTIFFKVVRGVAMIKKLIVLTLMILLIGIPIQLRAASYTISELGLPGALHSFCSSINNSGQVVGRSYIRGTDYHAFLWENGSITDLGMWMASDINSSGQIVGHTDYSPYEILLWQNYTTTALGQGSWPV